MKKRFTAFRLSPTRAITLLPGKLTSLFLYRWLKSSAHERQRGVLLPQSNAWTEQTVRGKFDYSYRCYRSRIADLQPETAFRQAPSTLQSLTQEFPIVTCARYPCGPQLKSEVKSCLSLTLRRIARA